MEGAPMSIQQAYTLLLAERGLQVVDSVLSARILYLQTLAGSRFLDWSTSLALLVRPSLCTLFFRSAYLSKSCKSCLLVTFNLFSNFATAV